MKKKIYEAPILEWQELRLERGIARTAGTEKLVIIVYDDGDFWDDDF